MLKLLLLFCLVEEIWSGKSKKNERAPNTESIEQNLEPELEEDQPLINLAQTLQVEAAPFVPGASSHQLHLRHEYSDPAGIKSERCAPSARRTTLSSFMVALNALRRHHRRRCRHHHHRLSLHHHKEEEEPNNIHVTVSKMSGSFFDFDTTRDKTVLSLKKWIHDNYGYPPLVQTLIVGVSPREDSESFQDIVGDAEQIEFKLLIGVETARRLVFLPEATLEDRRDALLALLISEVGDEATVDLLIDLIQNDLQRPWSLIHESLYVLARIARTDDGRAFTVMENVFNSWEGHIKKAAKDAIKKLRQRARQQK